LEPSGSVLLAIARDLPDRRQHGRLVLHLPTGNGLTIVWNAASTTTTSDRQVERRHFFPAAGVNISRGGKKTSIHCGQFVLLDGGKLERWQSELMGWQTASNQKASAGDRLRPSNRCRNEMKECSCWFRLKKDQPEASECSYLYPTNRKAAIKIFQIFKFGSSLR
jgi:hypothetical protein